MKCAKSSSEMGELQGRFEFDAAGLPHAPRYNIAPSQPLLAVLNGGERRAAHLRWGLIPSWAKSAAVGSRLINARAETVAERPSFRTALARRRCLVLADGFYEWQRAGKARRPMRVTLKSGEPFAFAGLWESWRDPDGEIVRSCTIITTEANELLRPVHERMPVILPKEMESLWLDEDVQDAAPCAACWLHTRPGQWRCTKFPPWSTGLPMTIRKWLSRWGERPRRSRRTMPERRWCSVCGMCRIRVSGIENHT